MSDTNAKAKNLLMRDLTEEVNEGLEWGKYHFGQNTNTGAAEKMISTYRQVYEELQKAKHHHKELKALVRRLLEQLDQKNELEKDTTEVVNLLRKEELKY